MIPAMNRDRILRAACHLSRLQLDREALEAAAQRGENFLSRASLLIIRMEERAAHQYLAEVFDACGPKLTHDSIDPTRGQE